MQSHPHTHPNGIMQRNIPQLALLLALAMGICTKLRAQEAAKFAPANAVAFVQIDDLSSLRKDWEQDPLATYIKENLPLPPQQGWEDLQKLMGLTEPQLIDKYLGQAVTLIAFESGENPPLMVVSKVTQADADLAIEKMQLKMTGTLGAWKGYDSTDAKATIVVGGGWVIVVDKRIGDAVKPVLEGKGKTLADDPAFVEWIGKLPKSRSVTAFMRQGDTEAHAIAAVRQGRNVTLHYRGKSAEFEKITSVMSDGKALDFGPLPAATIAAVNLNVKIEPPGDGKQIDRLFPGKSFRKDIAPKLGSPLIAFLGEVPGSQLEPRANFSAPVLGVALRLRDRKVGDDLTSTLNSLMVLANVAAANWNIEPVEVTEMAHANVPYRVAEIGAALSNRLQRPEAAHLKIAYGRVGDHFVICSHDKFFAQCIDASLDSTRGLSADRQFTAMALKPHEQPIVTAVLKPAALSAHLNGLLEHWRKERPQLLASATADPQVRSTQPPTPEAQLVRGVNFLSGFLNHYQSMSLQIWRDGETIAGQADVVRK